MVTETITSFDDLIGVLERNPQYRSQLRQSILDEEFQRLPEQVTALTEQVRALSEAIASLAERMDQRMLSQEGRTDWLIGAMAELRFRQRAAAYFGHILRRLQVIDSSALADQIDDAIDAGTFAEADREPLMRLDVVARGRDRVTREPRYLAVEVSAGLGEGDILRAADRAAVLSRLTGVPAVPVVAGYSIAPQFRSIADQRNVQVVITDEPR